MGVGVMGPKPKQNDGSLGKLLTIGGMVGGGIASSGSPAGIAAGGSLGGMAGGLLSGPQVQAGPEPIQTGGSDALQRRMQSLQQNPQMQIANSIDSLKYIEDPQMRADLAKPLLQADYMARNKGQV